MFVKKTVHGLLDKMPKPGFRPHALIKQVVAKHGHYNDLFSTKLIETSENTISESRE
jgi:hypothetical protein